MSKKQKEGFSRRELLERSAKTAAVAGMAGLGGFAALASLGAWQLQRLERVPVEGPRVGQVMNGEQGGGARLLLGEQWRDQSGLPVIAVHQVRSPVRVGIAQRQRHDGDGWSCEADASPAQWLLDGQPTGDTTRTMRITPAQGGTYRYTVVVGHD